MKRSLILVSILVLVLISVYTFLTMGISVQGQVVSSTPYIQRAETYDKNGLLEATETRRVGVDVLVFVYNKNGIVTDLRSTNNAEKDTFLANERGFIRELARSRYIEQIKTNFKDNPAAFGYLVDGLVSNGELTPDEAAVIGWIAP